MDYLIYSASNCILQLDGIWISYLYSYFCLNLNHPSVLSRLQRILMEMSYAWMLKANLTQAKRLAKV